MSDESPAADADTTRAAGRGGLAIAGAKATFIVFGLGQQLILTRLLGTAGYGQFRVILLLVSMVNNTVVAMSIQGVSRAVSRAVGREAEAYRAALRLHLVVAVAVGAAFALSAGTLASIECAPYLATPLRVVSLVVLLYGLYAPVVGSLNGRRRFLDQAGLDTGYTVLRTLALALGAVAWKDAPGGGVLGACFGFALAAAVILPIAIARAGIGRPSESTESTESTSSYLAFLLPVGGGQILQNLLLASDLFLLRRFLGLAANAACAPEVTASANGSADDLAGVYAGAQTFAFLPYQFLMSVTFILFPMLARAQAEGDRAAVRSFTMSGVRIAMILTAIITGTISGLAPSVLRLAYPENMARGGDTLRILCLGMGAFSVLGVICAALTGLGRAKDSALLTGLGVALIAGGCSIFVPTMERGLAMLTMSATVTSTALAITALVGAARLRSVAGGFVELPTFLRTSLTLAALVAVGTLLPWAGKLATVAEAAALAALGFGILVATRELGPADLDRVRAIVGRRKATS